MAQINVRIDDNIKSRAENACADMGLTMSSAISIFLTKVANERRIPFEVSADPFYSEENIRHLEGIIRDIQNGTAHFESHELIEVD